MTQPYGQPPQHHAPFPARRRPSSPKLSFLIALPFMVGALIAGCVTHPAPKPTQAKAAATVSANPSPSVVKKQIAAVTPAPTTAATTAAECHHLHWPRPIPVVLLGKDLSKVTKGTATLDVQCFNIVHMLAPDGHEVFGNPAHQISDWKVIRSVPKLGTSVADGARITLYVALKHPAQQPAPQPTQHKPPPQQPPVDPGGATALCNDGTYSYSAHHQGTCSHHHGVAQWYR
jgi:Protein of unknown function (DUF3761)